ncbi:MAG: hypothetical protein GX997_03730 [Bacteroidales bacterium]|nr:hypothetical protein [Bacteroidales bacterium]
METFAEFIEKGCYKVLDALAQLGYAAVKIDETTPFYDHHLFFNLNTLPDYHYVLQYIENRKKRES